MVVLKLEPLQSRFSMFEFFVSMPDVAKYDILNRLVPDVELCYCSNVYCLS